MRSLAILATIFLAGLAASSISSACSVGFVPGPISVGSSFKVKVSGSNGPVKGLPLHLTNAQGRAGSAITDAGGIAQFDNVPTGTQYLGADHDTNGYGLELDVRVNSPANILVPMGWPSIEPIHVRSLSGTMRASFIVRSEPLSLELLEGISGRILSSIDTGGRGEFDFGALAPGIYFIHLKPYEAFHQLEGLIGVAVDPGAPERADKLDLNLTWTSCGLMYTDQSQCPQPDLRVKRLEGRAGDSTGRAAQPMEIVLLDAARQQVAHVSTDPNGDFSFPGPLVGTFELRIDGSGYTPVHTPIHIEPDANDSSLEVEVQRLSCSTVRMK